MNLKTNKVQQLFISPLRPNVNIQILHIDLIFFRELVKRI